MHTDNIVEKGEALNKAKNALIMLHGRGATASGILELGEVIGAEGFYIAAPQAANNSWYPYSFMVEEETNEPWLTSAVATVKGLIDDISRYIPKSRIYILGFSQGACLALEVSSRYAEKYGGVVAFTGGLILSTSLLERPVKSPLLDTPMKIWPPRELEKATSSAAKES